MLHVYPLLWFGDYSLRVSKTGIYFRGTSFIQCQDDAAL